LQLFHHNFLVFVVSFDRLWLVLNHERNCDLELLLQVHKFELVHLNFVIESVNAVNTGPFLDEIKHPHKLVLLPLVQNMEDSVVVLEQKIVIKLISLIYQSTILRFQRLKLLQLVIKILLN